MLPYHFPRHVRQRLGALGYVRSDLVSNWTFRQRLIGGYATIAVVGGRAFNFEMSLDHFFEALQNGWRLGRARIRAHDAGFVASLGRPNIPTAWKIVTGYYSAYFAALELLRAAGLVITYLGSNHVEQLLSASANLGIGNLEVGTYVGQVTANALNGTVEGRLARSNSPDHDTVWRRLDDLIARLTPRGSEERQVQKLLVDVLRNESRWLSPNAVRNQWNYARPDLYADEGETTGRSFCAIAGDDDSAHAWPQRRRLQPDPPSVAATVAVWRALLVDSVDQVDPILRS